MTDEQKYELGKEIIAGMHASAYRVDIAEGRRLVEDDMDIPLVYAAVQEQALFIADIALNKLAELHTARSLRFLNTAGEEVSPL